MTTATFDELARRYSLSVDGVVLDAFREAHEQIEDVIEGAQEAHRTLDRALASITAHLDEEEGEAFLGEFADASDGPPKPIELIRS